MSSSAVKARACTVKLTAQAVRAINKAIAEAREPELVQALEEGKRAITAYLE